MEASRQLRHLLHPVQLRTLVCQWLCEDTPSFDYSGFVVGESEEQAVILCKSPGVFAGAPFVEAVFKELECSVEWLINEGDYLNPQPTCEVGKVIGKVRHLLLGERIVLNCITRASGVATIARRLKETRDHHGWHGEVAGTRKTTPVFRMVEKYALLVGGLSSHRYDLSSMIMLKDNHIWTAGSISQAVRDARQVGGFSLKVEVECRSLEEGLEAARSGCDVVMLDNFTPKALHECASDLKNKYPHLLVEASGGVTEDTIQQYFGPNIDVISLSKTTQGYSTVDFSFKIQKSGRDLSNPLVQL